MFLLILTVLVSADDDQARISLAAKLEAAADAQQVERLLNAPDDVPLLREYIRNVTQELRLLEFDDPVRAETQLTALERVLNRLMPGSADAQQLIGRAKETNLRSSRERFAIAKTSYTELEAKLLAAPVDYALFQKWTTKLSSEGIALAFTRPDEAQKTLTRALAFAKRLDKLTHHEQVKLVIAAASEEYTSPFSMTQKLIDDNQKLSAMVGKDADPLDVTGWAVGPATTLAELRGKVVLISFMSPIAPSRLTLPHLKAWEATHAGSGLRIVGVMSTEQTGSTFATQHELKFPIAVRKRQPAEYFGLADKDGLVVIDQGGKIRLVRASPYLRRNLEDTDKLLSELMRE